MKGTREATTTPHLSLANMLKDHLDSQGGQHLNERMKQQIDDQHGASIMALIDKWKKTGKSEPYRDGIRHKISRLFPLGERCYGAPATK
jgi:hypothetical protein